MSSQQGDTVIIFVHRTKGPEYALSLASRLWISMAFCLALAASASLIAAMNISKDSFQRDHGVNGSPGRARNGGRGEKESSIFVANVTSRKSGDNDCAVIPSHG
ncbi:hypothetical protein ILYODFUR_038211 [Ilyodon furcidens]|uniref:CASP-like protein n=1 Tax=Ilyodon furcidens TaxID=33524 RepID=A0ABV0T532_9TELE